jgi:thioredoxin 1
MSAPGIVILTQANFAQEVIESPTPVLVYFWAAWCRPCKTIAPVLSELADQYEDQLKIGQINIDDEPALASEYGIRAIPTMLLMCRGQIVADRMVGRLIKSELEDSFAHVVA